MPVYQYRCPECLEVEEKLMPMADRNEQRQHSCGVAMERLMSTPSLIVMAVTGTDKILDTLNGEREGVRSKRSQDALARGLNYERPCIGRGF